jgi:hypothetical protein
LIKDYEVEVHYHPGKENVVADALSRKAHYNYLPVVHSAGEESSNSSVTRFVIVQHYPHTYLEV